MLLHRSRSNGSTHLLVVAFHLYFNKQSLPEDQKSETATLASLRHQAAMAHTFNPNITLTCHRNQKVVVHALNPRTRKDDKMEEAALRLSLILKFLVAGSAFQTEVKVKASGWLFYFCDLQRALFINITKEMSLHLLTA